MYTETTTAEEQQEPYHLFTEDDISLHYQEASQGQRVLNFIVDSLLIRFGLSYAFGFVLGYLFYTISTDMYTAFFFNDDKVIAFLLNYILGAFIYVVYYTFCEKVFQGVTLGKLITGTKAIREDGQGLTFKDAILRSLSRVVPLEAFSALWAAPWHDTWTQTMVIKTR
jgi:uncharacterized RDD family membrane protein YckC